MREAVRELTGKPGGPRDVDTNHKMIRRATKREKATLEDWKALIDAQLESVRPNPSAWRYLTLSTITKPTNWARIMDAPMSPKATAPVQTGGAFVPHGRYS